MGKARAESEHFRDKRLSEVGIMSYFYFRLLVVLFLTFSAVSGQNNAPPQLQPRPSSPAVPPPASTDRQITLDVQVADKSGAPLRGLQKQNFTVLDDKQPKTIQSFRAVDGTADIPVEI